MIIVGKISRAWPRLRDDVLYWRVPGSILMPRPLRRRWLAWFGVDVHRSVSLAPRIRLMGPRLSIGARSFINYDVFIDTADAVSIGADVEIGMRVMLITSTHEFGSTSHRAGASASAPIRIGDGTWIGAGAIVLPGVTIGNGSVVASGSVVTSDVEANSLVGGVPARVLRRLED